MQGHIPSWDRHIFGGNACSTDISDIRCFWCPADTCELMYLIVYFFKIITSVTVIS